MGFWVFLGFFVLFCFAVGWLVGLGVGGVGLGFLCVWFGFFYQCLSHNEDILQ